LRRLPGAAKAIIVAAGLLSFAAPGARGTGPIADAADRASFARAPYRRALDASIMRSDGRGQAASVFSLAAALRVRSSFLIEGEIPYITIASGGRMEDGFGDFLINAKARGWHGDRRALQFAGGLRLGAGALALFPYATASTDAEAGLSFVDSLIAGGDGEARPSMKSLSYWISTSFVYVLRVNDGLEEAELHGHHAIAGGGVLAALTPAFEIEAGGIGFFFETGATRQVCFTRLSYKLGEAIRIHATVQGEIGDSGDRAADASAAAGVAVAY
jgi:hypothetical protein